MTRPTALIIAGSNKCGTTSVFRYLGDHPAVCPSSRKETGFFFKDRDFRGAEARTAFENLFPQERAADAILLEATPSYMDRGRLTAERIKAVLGNPRVMLLIRNPAHRFVSHYRSRHGLIGDAANELSFAEFVDAQMRAADAFDRGENPDQGAGRTLRKGRYAALIEDYVEVFGASSMLIRFFEDLSADPRSFMRQLCEDLEIDPSYFDDYRFRVENRSRYHYSARLRTIGTRVNQSLEPLLNRAPVLRRIARGAYNALNTSRNRRPDMPASQLERLSAYYAPHNATLRRLLRDRLGDPPVPDWLA